MMAKIGGLTKLVEQLRAKAAKSRKEDNVSVSVGFTQQYAIFVHEDMTARHPVGQAKYLEQPARQLSSDGTLGRIVLEAKQNGKTMAQGLLLAGLRLQREAQMLTPVDTGALKASAFTRLDS
jgi:CRISPR/Cas system-associated exonuclease Cas4 (RecB family)